MDETTDDRGASADRPRDPVDDPSSASGSRPGPGAQVPPVPPPPPPGGSAPPRRLTRDTEGAVLGGVAAGLGRHLGVDPVVMRLAFIGLALLGGTGALLYAIAWVIVPGDDERATGAAEDSVLDRAADRLRRAPLWVQVVGVVFVALLIAGEGSGVPPTLLWAIVLVVGGALLFRAADRRDELAAAGPPPAAPPPSTPSTWAGGRWTGGSGPGTAHARTDLETTQVLGDGPLAGGGDGAGHAGHAEAQARPPRRRSVLGRVTVALILVAGGVAALLEEAGVLALAPRHYVAGALVAVGAGLLVAAWYGRAPGLIGLGVLLVPVLLLMSLPALPLGGGIGEQTHLPVTAEALAPGYQLGIGNLVVDLTEVDGDDPLDVVVRLGMGELEIIVPPDADVHLDGAISGGQVTALGRRAQGTALDLSTLDLPGGDGRRITLDVAMGFGTLEVRTNE